MRSFKYKISTRKWKKIKTRFGPMLYFFFFVEVVVSDTGGGRGARRSGPKKSFLDQFEFSNHN